MNGHCRFLIKEQEAKSKILATKKGQKMSAFERARRLSPYSETTHLFEEMCNLAIKQTGNLIAVEQINRRINKDRFSAFEYGLWRIKEEEEKYFLRKKRKKINWDKFVMFNKGGKSRGSRW